MAMLRLAVFVALALAGAAPANIGAQNRPSREYEIKAGFLFNFVKLVEWDDGAPVRKICVLGRDPFGPALDALRGRQAGGRRVAVEVLGGSSSLDGCHLLFVSRDTPDDGVRAALESGALTVGETSGFASGGGVIELGVVRNRVRFEVNLRAARAAGLTLSSQLLRVAHRVQSE